MIYSDRTYEHRGCATRRDHLLPVIDTPRSALTRVTPGECLAAALFAIALVSLVVVLAVAS